MRLTTALLACALFTTAALAQPKSPAVDGGDQSAGRATPSRDTAPQPTGPGTPPTNTGADAGATTGAETNTATGEAASENTRDTLDVNPNAAVVAPKPPASEVNPPESTEEKPKP